MDKLNQFEWSGCSLELAAGKPLKARFETFIPSPILRPYVKAFAISEAETESTYKVLPDTGVVIGFQYRGRLSYLENEKEIHLAASGVTGLRDSYRIFKNSANIGTVLVFFRDAGAAMFFKEPVHELFRKSISLDDIHLRSELLMLEEQLWEAHTDTLRITAVEQFLMKKMKPDMKDDLVSAALNEIYSNSGKIRIRNLAEKLNSSQSVLEKRFRRVVGASPKKFASIVRFKHAIQNFTPQQSLTALGYECGYYDQAHFIKEFKSFTGESPEKFFSKE